MELLLIRHGRPDEHDADTPHDPPLHEDGWRQAQAIADQLGRYGIARIVASPMRRAQQTAAPLAERTGLPVSTVDGWAEADRDSGPYRSMETLRAAGGEAWARFLADPIRFLGADPETFRATVLDAFAQTINGDDHGTRVAVFCHGMPINIVVAHLLGLDTITKFAIRYGSITRVLRSRGGKTGIVSVNETGHLHRGVAVGREAAR